MSLNLVEEHKQQLVILAKQSAQVIQDFCKLATEYIQKGPNAKVYISAGQKLEQDPVTIKKLVKSIIHLLLESSKCKAKDEDLHNCLIALGFDVEKATIITNFYSTKKVEIVKLVNDMSLILPQYHDLDWRFEVEIASRTASQQVVPLVTLDLALKNSDNGDVEHKALQTDPKNLLHLVQELQLAMQESRSQHVRTISRVIK